MAIITKTHGETIKEIFPTLTDEEIKGSYKIELVVEIDEIARLKIYKYPENIKTNIENVPVIGEII